MTATLVTMGLTVLVTVIAALVTEYALRFLLPRYAEKFPWAPNLQVEMEVLREVLPQLEARVRFYINSDGERGDPPMRRGEDCYRVLVSGDSFAESWFVDQETNWCAVLQRQLNAPASLEALGNARVHVGSIARSLTTCRKQQTLLRSVLHRYERIDLLVLVPGLSEAVLWVQEGAPAELRARTAEDGEPNYGQHGNGPFGWRPARTATYRCISNMRNRLFVTRSHRTGCGMSVKKLRDKRATARIDDHQPDPSAILERYAEDLDALVRYGCRIARRVFVAIPAYIGVPDTPADEGQFWNFGYGNPHVGAVERYMSSRVAANILAAFNATTERVAAAAGVEFCRLEDHVDRNFEAFYDRIHLTAKGGDQVGRAIAAAVLAGSRHEPRAN